MKLSSALYKGRVHHRRTRPKEHVLNYRVFWMLIDLSEIDRLNQGLRLFSHNRFNLLSFHDRDHGDGTGLSLRDQICCWLGQAGVELNGGAVRLLTMPRVLGYVFNPISIYYCHDDHDRLVALVYEVTSTFGVRHTYVIPVSADDKAQGRFVQSTPKSLYVSPFMGMEMDYAFRGHVPSENLDVAIDGLDSQGVLISASISAQRKALTDAALLSAAVRVPFLTLKVVAAIHWEALKICLKGIKLTRQPEPASHRVTIQRQTRSTRLG